MCQYSGHRADVCIPGHLDEGDWPAPGIQFTYNHIPQKFNLGSIADQELGSFGRSVDGNLALIEAERPRTRPVRVKNVHIELLDYFRSLGWLIALQKGIIYKGRWPPGREQGVGSILPASWLSAPSSSPHSREWTPRAPQGLELSRLSSSLFQEHSEWGRGSSWL